MTKSMDPFFGTLNFWATTTCLPVKASGARPALMTLDNSCTCREGCSRGTGDQHFGFKVLSDINLRNWWCWSFAVPNWVYKCRYLIGIWWVSVVKTYKNCQETGYFQAKHWSSSPYFSHERSVNPVKSPRNNLHLQDGELAAHPTNESSWRFCRETQM